MALLCTVGSIKRDLGVTWVNVDASTNNLMRIDTSGRYTRSWRPAASSDP